MVVSRITMGAIVFSCLTAVIMALRCGDTTTLEIWLTAFRTARLTEIDPKGMRGMEKAPGWKNRAMQLKPHKMRKGSSCHPRVHSRSQRVLPMFRKAGFQGVTCRDASLSISP
jgi:hypothetical protein